MQIRGLFGVSERSLGQKSQAGQPNQWPAQLDEAV